MKEDFREELKKKITVKGYLGNNLYLGLIIGLCVALFISCIVGIVTKSYIPSITIFFGVIIIFAFTGFMLKRKFIKVGHVWK